jgi:hypothetical protein
MSFSFLGVGRNIPESMPTSQKPSALDDMVFTFRHAVSNGVSCFVVHLEWHPIAGSRILKPEDVGAFFTQSKCQGESCEIMAHKSYRKNFK